MRTILLALLFTIVYADDIRFRDNRFIINCKILHSDSSRVIVEYYSFNGTYQYHIKPELIVETSRIDPVPEKFSSKDIPSSLKSHGLKRVNPTFTKRQTLAIPVALIAAISAYDHIRALSYVDEDDEIRKEIILRTILYIGAGTWSLFEGKEVMANPNYFIAP